MWTGQLLHSSSWRIRSLRLVAAAGLFMALLLPQICAADWSEPLRVWPRRQVDAHYWADPTGTATLEQARQQFEAGRGLAVDPERVMPIGWGRAVWYRLVTPGIAQPARAVLTVPFPGIDRLDLYRQDGAGAWQVQSSGDTVPVDRWAMRYHHPAFAFTLQPTAADISFLRVQHSHDTGVSWVLRDAGSFSETSRQAYLLFGMVGGITGLVILLSLFNAISWRDPLHLYYAIHTALIGLTVASLNGFAGEQLWPANAWLNDIASWALPALVVGWLALFVRALAGDRAPRPFAWLLLVLFVAGLGVAAALLINGRAQSRALHEAYHLFLLISLVCTVAMAAWDARRQRQAGAGWIVAGFVTLMVGSWFPILRNLGLLPLSVATQYGPSIAWVIEVPLVLAGLYFRSRARRDRRLRLQSLARTDALTGAANHEVMMDRMQVLLRNAAVDPASGAVVRVRVGNLETIRARHGREAAEAALLRAVECLSLEAGDQDTVAREKGGDLVLLLTGRVEPGRAAATGRDLIARGLKYSGRLPPQVTLSLHVAVAGAPLPALGAAELLAQLGEQVDAIGRAPQGRALRVLGARDPASAVAEGPQARYV
jgi:GGDEF domain-containing protein